MIDSLFISSNQTMVIAVNEQTRSMLCGGDIFLIIILIFNTQYHVICEPIIKVHSLYINSTIWQVLHTVCVHCDC